MSDRTAPPMFPRFQAAARGALQAAGAPVMRGTAQFPTETILPTRNPEQGGQRRYVLSDPLIFNTEFGDYSGLGGNPQAHWRVSNPSTRLHLLMAWTYEPDATEDTDWTLLPTPWTVTADAWIRPESGKARIMRANNIFTNRLIPTSYEAITGVDEVRGVVTVPVMGEASGTGQVPGKLWLTAMWEPAPGWEVNDDELRRLFNVCRIYCEGIAVSESGVQPIP